MAAHAFPYTYISCPCSDLSRRILTSKRLSRDVELDEELQEEEKTFDPRNPRSSFSLFPPEHLLYCEECHDIKCPRCISEEIICSYCPSCLFEVPSSSVKQDNNRCARNCFTCPICTSQLITASIGDKSEGPYILSCNYCMWTSLEAGIKFDKPQSLRQQLDRLTNGGKRSGPLNPDRNIARRGLAQASERFGLQDNADFFRKAVEEDEAKAETPDPKPIKNPHSRFEALRSFYKDQLTQSGESSVTTSSMDYSSPSSLSRIMNLYANAGSNSFKRAKPQNTPMREALNPAEGLLVPSSTSNASKFVQSADYIDVPSEAQLAFQHPHPTGNPFSNHVSELRPMATLLRTKRSKRCAACKHILVKPEFKVTSTRYRIKLIALNYIPLITLTPLPESNGLRPAGPDGTDVVLQPGKPSQWIMTLKNPLFESVQVSLGSPNITPGKHGHKVTILCPQFSIGKNGDVWDDALNANSAKFGVNATNIGGGGGGEQIAGKVYDSGKNWTSIVLEVIPASINRENEGILAEDEDVIEIPIRVRLEWTVSDEDGDGSKKKSERALGDDAEVDDGKRELAYWMVLGIARVGPLT